MNILKMWTYEDIMALGPCYDPAERGFISENWCGTVIDILNLTDVPAKDRLWVVLRKDWLPERLMHEFGIRCAERTLQLINNPDPRSLNALIVKRLWLDGKASNKELNIARRGAKAAAEDVRVSWTAAETAAWNTWAAARNDAWAAACADPTPQIEQLIKIIQEYEQTTTQYD
jgi:hypothetical protein